MTLQGDLTTLDLTSLFQSLDAAGKTGLLTVRDGDEETLLYFERGKLSLLARPRRAPLVDFLIDAGVVAAPEVEKAKKMRRRGQPLCAALVESGALDASQLSSVTASRLTDDACEVLAAGANTFELSEVGGPPAGFDPEERALEMALDVGPLLLESARRSDHWSMIREQVPSDSMHYRIAKPPREPGDREQARVLSQLSKLLDGSRNVREVVAQFPTRRFEAYQLLADLARSQTIRPVAVGDLNAQVLELARRDRKRAAALLDRGLDQNPHNVVLLRTKALLAEKMGDKEKATEALKLVAHLSLEGAQSDEARAALDKLKDLDANDPFAWEKSFDLALEEDRRDDATDDAKALAELYRKLGLHKKVIVVFERLGKLLGARWEIVRELARARAASGDIDGAVKGLEKHAAGLVDLESYPAACKVYEEILGIQPTRAKAKEMLEQVKSGALAQRKARWRRIRRRAALYFVAFVVLPWLGFEALARRDYVAATREIVRDRLLETGRFADARARYAAVRSSFPWTTTALFEIKPILRELDARIVGEEK